MKRHAITTRRSESTTRDENGAIIILALIYILVVSVTVGALLSWTLNDLNNTTHFTNATNVRYAATSAVDAAIQSIRYSPIPSSTPTQGVATPVSYCWSPPSIINGSTQISDLTLDGSTVGVWCSTLEELSSSDTRDVSLYACNVTSESTGSSCAANPLLSAEVAIDDYPAGGGPTFKKQCNLLGESCGAGTILENWTWGPSTGQSFASQPQTVAFYNSSYSATMTSDSVTYGTGTYQLYARGSGGGSITYGSLTSSVCTVSAVGSVTLVSAGTCTLTADAAATPGYTDSGVGDFALTVNQASTSLAVTSSVNPSTINQAVTYTATVSVTAPASGTPTGSVEFLDGGSLIGTCTAQALSGTSTDTATCTLTYTSSGSHSITAKYLGNSNFAASAVSPSITQTVNNLSYSGGSSNNIPSGTYYYSFNSTTGGSSHPSGATLFTETTGTTLTSLTVTLSASTSASTVVTVGVESGSFFPGTFTATALTCTVASGQTTKTCFISASIAANSKLEVSTTGNNQVSATWVTTYTQP